MGRILVRATVVAITLLFANVGFAVGLGEITLKSYLNQPFNAEIELLSVGDLSEEEIISKLAVPKDFANAGINREYFLTQLKFAVFLKGENNRDYIAVTSNHPVNEPFLDFLVELLWPPKCPQKITHGFVDNHSPENGIRYITVAICHHHFTVLRIAESGFGRQITQIPQRIIHA